jgi:type I restriction enzyme S subunit
MPDHSLLLESPPHGWMPVNFSDTCTRVQETAAPSADGERYYLGLEHIASGLPGLVGRGKESDVRSGKTAFRKSDVLFGKLRPYLRKSVLVHENGICSTDILVFRATEICIPELLCFLTHTDEFVGHAKATTSGVQHPRTSWAALREFKLHIPPLHEQRKIAAVLGLVQRAIEEQKRLLAVTNELKKTLLHKLFTEGLRSEPQKQTEIGPVPRSWEMVKIGSLGKVVTGTTPKTKVPEYYAPPEVDFISPADLGRTRQVYRSEKKISRHGLEVIRCLPKDAVMCVCIGSSIGKVGMTSKADSATNQQINSIICNDKHDPAFVYYLLSYFAEYWRGFATFGPVPILSKGSFENIKIVVPLTKEEEEIAQCLTAVDAKLEVHMHRKALLNELFRNLLHQLMTAQIRVHDLDLSKRETDETE